MPMVFWKVFFLLKKKTKNTYKYLKKKQKKHPTKKYKIKDKF